MKTKILLGLSILAVPIMACAGGVQFTVINDSPTMVQSPIKVISGYILYGFLPPADVILPSHCPLFPVYAQVDLGTVTTLPLAIDYGTGQQFTFPIPSDQTDCFVSGQDDSTTAIVNLIITQVDGITREDGGCGTTGSTSSNDYTGQAKLEIQELASPPSLNCWSVSATQK